MSTTNIMDFVVQYRFKQKLDSDELSRNLYGTIMPSVLHGYEVTRESPSSVRVGVGTLWVGDNNDLDMVFWVNATKEVVIPVLNSGRYLCLTYQYQKAVLNYPEFIVTDTPSFNDVVLAEIVWGDSSTIIEVSNRVKTKSLQDELNESIRSLGYELNYLNGKYYIDVNEGSVLFDGKVYGYGGGSIELPSIQTTNLLIYLKKTDAGDQLELAISDKVPSTQEDVPTHNIPLEVDFSFIPICQFDVGATNKPLLKNLYDRRANIIGVLGNSTDTTRVPLDVQERLTTIKGTTVTETLLSTDEIVSNVENIPYASFTGLLVTRLNSTTLRVGSGVVWYPRVIGNVVNMCKIETATTTVQCTEVVSDPTGAMYMVRLIVDEDREPIFSVVDLGTDVPLEGNEVFIALVKKQDTSIISQSVKVLNVLYTTSIGVGLTYFDNSVIKFNKNPLINKTSQAEIEYYWTSTGKCSLMRSIVGQASLWSVQDTHSSPIVDMFVSEITRQGVFTNKSISYQSYEEYYYNPINYCHSGRHAFNDGITFVTGKIGLPLNYQYIQVAHPSTGMFRNEDSPSMLFGGTWSLIWNSDSVTMRTEGTLANTDRDSNGIQGDAIRNIRGAYSPSYTESSNSAFGIGYSGAVAPVASGITARGQTTGTGSGATGMDFDASRVVPTSTENRMRNILMRIWVKVGN